MRLVSSTSGRYGGGLVGLKEKERKMSDAKMPLKCPDCEREWTEHFDLPMNMNVFIKKSKAIACPGCGSKKAGMVPSGDFFVEDKQRKQNE